jgi:hypothetical protein
MSDTRREGDLEGRGARFDEAIDRVVREMLDVEPPAGLRGRVMQRIDDPVASAFRRKAAWLVAPLAAAAVIILAVLAPWRPETGTQPPPFRGARDTRLAVESSPRPPVAEAPRPAPPRVAADIRPRTTAPGLVLAADAAGEEINFTTVEPLGGPASIAVERLARPEAAAMRSIEPAPLQISPLVVNALPETPRERREE